MCKVQMAGDSVHIVGVPLVDGILREQEAFDKSWDHFEDH